jgi:transcriptional regulator
MLKELKEKFSYLSFRIQGDLAGELAKLMAQSEYILSEIEKRALIKMFNTLKNMKSI